MNQFVDNTPNQSGLPLGNQPVEFDELVLGQLDSETHSSNEEPTSIHFPHRSLKKITAKAPLRLVETAFLASTASLIWLVNFFFPLGPVLRIFFPLPIALLSLRWGGRTAWMGCIVTGLLLSVLMGPPRSLLYMIPFGIMGVLLGGLWRRSVGWELCILMGTLVGSIGFFFRLWLMSLMLGDDLWLYLTIQVTGMIEWIGMRLGWLIQPQLLMVQIVGIGLIVVSNLIYLLVVHLVAGFMFDRLGNPISPPPKWVQIMLDY